jgi:hypothetical protein
MTITLPLQPQEEARLIAVAQAKGLSTGAPVREALDKILAEAPEVSAQPARESRPIWEVILDNMKDVPPEEFAKLPKDGAASMITISTGIRSGIHECGFRRHLL